MNFLPAAVDWRTRLWTTVKQVSYLDLGTTDCRESLRDCPGLAVEPLLVWTEEPQKQGLTQVVNMDSSHHPTRCMDTFRSERNKEGVGQMEKFYSIGRVKYRADL